MNRGVELVAQIVEQRARVRLACSHQAQRGRPVALQSLELIEQGLWRLRSGDEQGRDGSDKNQGWFRILPRYDGPAALPSGGFARLH